MAELAEFKKQVTRDIAALKAELIAYVDKRLGASETLVKKAINMTNNQQLAVRDDMKKELAVVCHELGKKVYNKIMDEIDEKVMPVIEDLQERVDYQAEDGNEIINEYQKAVFAECERSEGGGRLRITDGKSNRWNVGGATVGLFFDNN